MYVFLFFVLFFVLACIFLPVDIRFLMFGAPSVPSFNERVRLLVQGRSQLWFRVFAICIVSLAFVQTRKWVQFPKRKGSNANTKTFLLSDFVSLVFVYSISGAMISPFLKDFLKGSSSDLISIGFLVAIGSTCPFWYWVRSTQALNLFDVRDSYKRFMWTSVAVPASFLVWLGFGLGLFQIMTLSFGRFMYWVAPELVFFDNFLFHSPYAHFSTGLIFAYIIGGVVCYLLHYPVQRLKIWSLDDAAPGNER